MGRLQEESEERGESGHKDVGHCLDGEAAGAVGGGGSCGLSAAASAGTGTGTACSHVNSRAIRCASTALTSGSLLLLLLSAEVRESGVALHLLELGRSVRNALLQLGDLGVVQVLLGNKRLHRRLVVGQVGELGQLLHRLALAEDLLVRIDDGAFTDEGRVGLHRLELRRGVGGLSLERGHLGVVQFAFGNQGIDLSLVGGELSQLGELGHFPAGLVDGACAILRLAAGGGAVLAAFARFEKVEIGEGVGCRDEGEEEGDEEVEGTHLEAAKKLV